MKAVLIADPNPASSNAIFLWLAHKLGVKEIRQVSSGGCLAKQLEKAGAGIVLMDWSLPERPGPDFFQKIKEAEPAFELVILSEKAEVSNLAEGYPATFVHKALSPENLLAVLKPLLDVGAEGK